MPIKIPQSMDECIYFTNRSIGASKGNGEGQVIAWGYRKTCPKCKAAKMGKPVSQGKVKTRAQEYVCPGCGYEEGKLEHEDSLMLEAQYTCPACGKEGEGSGPYQRKNYQGIPSYLVECQHCHEKIPITKKLKILKGKKKKEEVLSEED